MNDVIEQYREAGKRWASGEDFLNPIVIGEKEWNLNPKQLEFLNARDRFSLFGGGMGAGKTTPLILKLILLCVLFPDNRILLGRKTRQSVEVNTLPDFFDICPESWVQYNQSKGIITFFNGSEILLKGLDALQEGSEQEKKKAVQEIKGLNLGAFFIDQLEEIEEVVFQALTSRLRRNVGFQQGCMTTNPANFWAYDYFKANPRAGTRLIETSMLDNKQYLAEDYIQSQLSQPESYVRRFVYGEWNPELYAEGGVFPQEYRTAQSFYLKSPQRTLDGILIWQEPKQGHEYQIGADTSDGNVDPCSLQVVDKMTGEQVASYSAFVPVHVQGEKLLFLAQMYSPSEKALIVLETAPSASGAAVLENIKKFWSRIYEREVFSYHEKKRTKKLGFNTSAGTKQLLIDHFTLLLKNNFIRIRDKEALNELSTFVWSNEAQKKGAGAQRGFHDDRLFALMLAYFQVQPKTLRESKLSGLLEQEQKKTKINFQYA
jgi:hypothetical protein